MKRVSIDCDRIIAVASELKAKQEEVDARRAELDAAVSALNALDDEMFAFMRLAVDMRAGTNPPAKPQSARKNSVAGRPNDLPDGVLTQAGYARRIGMGTESKSISSLVASGAIPAEAFDEYRRIVVEIADAGILAAFAAGKCKVKAVNGVRAARGELEPAPAQDAPAQKEDSPAVNGPEPSDPPKDEPVPENEPEPKERQSPEDKPEPVEKQDARPNASGIVVDLPAAMMVLRDAGVSFEVDDNGLFLVEERGRPLKHLTKKQMIARANELSNVVGQMATFAA